MTERPSCPTPARQPGSRSTSGVLLVAGLATVLLFFTANAVAPYVRLQRLREMSGKESHTHEVIATLGDVRRLIKDAETGQRGGSSRGMSATWCCMRQVALESMTG